MADVAGLPSGGNFPSNNIQSVMLTGKLSRKAMAIIVASTVIIVSGIVGIIVWNFLPSTKPPTALLTSSTENQRASQRPRRPGSSQSGNEVDNIPEPEEYLKNILKQTNLSKLTKEQEDWILSEDLGKLNLTSDQSKKAKKVQQNVYLRSTVLEAIKDQGKGAKPVHLSNYEEALSKSQDLGLTSKQSKALKKVVSKLKSTADLKTLHDQFGKAWSALITNTEPTQRSKLRIEAESAFNSAKVVYKNSSPKERAIKKFQRLYDSESTFSQYAQDTLIESLLKMINEQKDSGKKPENADVIMDMLQEFLEDSHDYKGKTYDQLFNELKDAVIPMEELHKAYKSALGTFLSDPTSSTSWEAVSKAWKLARDRLEQPDQKKECSSNVEYQHSYLQIPNAKSFEEYYLNTAKNDFNIALLSYLTPSGTDATKKSEVTKALAVLNHFPKCPMAGKSLTELEQLNKEYCASQAPLVQKIQASLLAIDDISNVMALVQKLSSQRKDFLFYPVCTDKLTGEDNDKAIVIQIASPKQTDIQRAFEERLKSVLIKSLPLNNDNLKKILEWHSYLSSKIMPELENTEAAFKAYGRMLAIRKYKNMLQAAANVDEADITQRDTKIKEAFEFISNITNPINLGPIVKEESADVANASKSLEDTTNYYKRSFDKAVVGATPKLDILEFKDWEVKIQKLFAVQMPYYYSYKVAVKYGQEIDFNLTYRTRTNEFFEDTVCKKIYCDPSQQLATLWTYPEDIYELQGFGCTNDNDGPLYHLFGDEFLKYRSPILPDVALRKIISTYQPYLFQIRFYDVNDYDDASQSFRMALWVIRLQQAISYAIRSLTFPYQFEYASSAEQQREMHEQKISSIIDSVLSFTTDALKELSKAKTKVIDEKGEPHNNARLIYRLLCTPLSEELAQLTTPLPTNQDPSRDVVDAMKILPTTLFKKVDPSKGISKALKTEQQIIDALNGYFSPSDRLAPIAGHLAYLNGLLQELVQVHPEQQELKGARADQVLLMMNPRFFYDEIVKSFKDAWTFDQSFFVASLVHGLPELYDWFYDHHTDQAERYMRPFSNYEYIHANYAAADDGPLNEDFLAISKVPGSYLTYIPESTLAYLQDLKTPNSRQLLRVIYQNLMDFTESPVGPHINPLDYTETYAVSHPARASAFKNTTLTVIGRLTDGMIDSKAYDNTVFNCAVFVQYITHFANLLFSPHADKGLQVFRTNVAALAPSLQASPRMGRLAGFTLGRLWQLSIRLKDTPLNPEWLKMAMNINGTITETTFEEFSTVSKENIPKISEYEDVRKRYMGASPQAYNGNEIYEDFRLIDRLTWFKSEAQQVFNQENSLLKVSKEDFQLISKKEYFYRFKYFALEFREGVHELLKYNNPANFGPNTNKQIRQLFNGERILREVIVEAPKLIGKELAKHVSFQDCDGVEMLDRDNVTLISFENAFKNYLCKLGDSKQDQNRIIGYLISTWSMSELPIGGYDKLKVNVVCKAPEPPKWPHNGMLNFQSCNHLIYSHGYANVEQFEQKMDLALDLSYANPDKLTDRD